MNIAITGAFSYSGKYITRRLINGGENVITLTNHPNRPDPFAGKVKSHPLNFLNRSELIRSLNDVDVLVNTYWIRFDRENNTQPVAVENTRRLVEAAAEAGVKRMIHISIANPSAASQLPYFWGKAANEKTVMDSGMSFGILRPTVLFGREDILINNIAWILRKFPVFGIPGDGSYRLSPVFVDDLAELAVNGIYRTDNFVSDAVGPDEFTFKEMVALIGREIGCQRPLIQMPPAVALFTAGILGLFVGDVILTADEVDGLMSNLLVSNAPPRCNTKLQTWLRENKNTVGEKYASELQRHYRRVKYNHDKV